PGRDGQPTTAAGLAWGIFGGSWLGLVGFRFSVRRAADGSPRVRVCVGLGGGLGSGTGERQRCQT
ncbi:MAG: hypothetical protein ACK5YC_09720, partial [Planctomyces sp.]